MDRARPAGQDSAGTGQRPALGNVELRDAAGMKLRDGAGRVMPA